MKIPSRHCKNALTTRNDISVDGILSRWEIFARFSLEEATLKGGITIIM